MPTLSRAAALAFCFALLAAPVRSQDPDATAALATWITAVNQHTAGKTDPAVVWVGRLVYADRLKLSPAMRLFFIALRGEPIATKSAADRRVMSLFRAVRGEPGPAVFLERAAVLHADAAMYRDRLDDVDDRAPLGERMSKLDLNALSRPARIGTEHMDALLTNVEATVFTDGRVVGHRPLDWNWTFARSLLDLLVRADPNTGTFKPSDIATAADLEFVAQWYHATAAYMLAMGKHGDLLRHLSHAAAVLPDDPRILFDRACLAEAFGLPLYQALADDIGFNLTVDVPTEDRADTLAEALFRRAIAVEPRFAEAHVRLARLLERRALHEEAASEIDRALAAHPTEAVAYFAHIVGGRIELARGHATEARSHYRTALAIHPDAQSALLGASHAAAMSSDVDGALASVQRLGDRTARFDADPWWIYHLGSGRDVDNLMAALWARVAR